MWRPLRSSVLGKLADGDHTATSTIRCYEEDARGTIYLQVFTIGKRERVTTRQASRLRLKRSPCFVVFDRCASSSLFPVRAGRVASLTAAHSCVAHVRRNLPPSSSEHDRRHEKHRPGAKEQGEESMCGRALGDRHVQCPSCGDQRSSEESKRFHRSHL